MRRWVLLAGSADLDVAHADAERKIRDADDPNGQRTRAVRPPHDVLVLRVSQGQAVGTPYTHQVEGHLNVRERASGRVSGTALAATPRHDRAGATVDLDVPLADPHRCRLARGLQQAERGSWTRAGAPDHREGPEPQPLVRTVCCVLGLTA